MAEKKKGRRRKDDLASDEPEKPSKEEYAVAKWLKKNLITKKTKFLNHNVEYFTAVKAVDALMTTRWAEVKEGEEPMFSTRMDVIKFLNLMLRHKFFHRAKKVPVTEQELKAKLKRKLEKEKKPDAEKRGKKGEEDKAEEAESSHTEGNKKDDKQPGTTDDKENKKRKTKIRLEMHLDQEFVDGLDAYVWIYDPIPVYYWFFGTLLVLGAIAVCLFPLWPPSVRKGVYYLSVLAAGFLIFIIALAILRVVVFCLLWVVTLGKHHLWLFPNLTEDVGFLASFWPIYQYEYKGNDLKEGKNSKKKKKDKDSDNEEDNQDTERDEADTNEDDSPAKPEEIAEETGLLAEREAENSESESESSQKSQTGKDFEMVERDEVES